MTMVNLKRALKIKKSLDAFLGTARVDYTANLSIFVEADKNNPEIAIEREAAIADESFASLIRGSEILSALRKSIVKANVDAGVEDLLADQANLDRQIRLHKQIVDSAVQQAPDIVKGDIALTAKTADAGQSASSSISRGVVKVLTVSIVSVERKKLANEALAALREARENIEDRRVGINANMNIEIAESDLTFLREIGVA